MTAPESYVMDIPAASVHRPNSAAYETRVLPKTARVQFLNPTLLKYHVIFWQKRQITDQILHKSYYFDIFTGKPGSRNLGKEALAAEIER